MRTKVLLSLLAVAVMAGAAVAIPDPTVLDRYSPVVVTPTKYCGLGAPPAALPAATLFSTDFEGSTPAYALTASSTNYWHVTSFAGQGTDVGHSGAKRLYYGVERPQGGTFNFGRTYGAITFQQPIAIPATGETLITWSEKWEVEWGAFGVYDAMALQLPQSPTAGWLGAGGGAGSPVAAASLCLSDPIDPVPQSTDPGTGIPACSPFLTNPCVTPPGWMVRHEFVPDSLKGKTVYLRFAFDAMDTLYNDFLGWQIDDINVVKLGA